MALKPLDDSATNMIALSENMEHIRRIVIPEEINTLLAGRNYLTLAQKMAEIARLANTCSGICFSFYIAGSKYEPKVGETQVEVTKTDPDKDGHS